ncbi:hypothetical protein SPRG_15460 [Saprolegnia parasitica CBS 223.65]|uniref:Uncharacterized protein n=1 Tax=Saprolegnia parasitica (strain CBS 223.65) TaxID=695850 RepID=A0A067BRE0_SAPPC|nr:hypothetical protein SPRG_15460 [Saprolegnia parasitica CBS 223.65]KDO19370.1 hypothetical protein SPRG_15460 [Saprolegnia parasitica CBS 223.65]|eukprot:XP_012209916.1 hypothetical protein SPRG_15460 [Saprolegnia parasitica CBS 223.65]
MYRQAPPPAVQAFPHDVHGEMARMREAIARLTQEKGQAEEMVGLLNIKLDAYNEELFDAKSNVAVIEAEANYRCQQNELATAQKVASLTSQVAFLREQIATSERAHTRLRKELESAQTSMLVEQKRLAAEKKLLETKKRQLHEMSSSQAVPSSQVASQRPFYPSQQLRTPPPRPQSPVVAPRSTATIAIQTEAIPTTSLSQENAELVHNLLQGAALLTLLNHVSSSDLDGPEAETLPHPDAPRDSEFSQLMQPFSQWFPPPPSPTVVKLAPLALAQQLYTTLSQLLAGESTSVHLIPLLTDYLLADIEHSVLTSALQVLFGLLHASTRVRAALRDPPSGLSTQSSISRIMLRGKPLAPTAPETARTDLDMATVRTKCMHALTRVLKHHVHQPAVLEHGLALWIQISRQGAETLLPVLQDIVGSPKSTSHVQVRALSLLMQLLQTENLFQIWRRQKQWLPLLLLKSPVKLGALHVTVQLALLQFVDFIIMTYGLPGATCILSHQPDEASIVQPIVRLMETAIGRLHGSSCLVSIMEISSGVCVDEADAALHLQLLRAGFQLISALEQYVELKSQVREPKQQAALYNILHYVQRELPRDAVTAMALISVLQTPAIS